MADPGSGVPVIIFNASHGLLREKDTSKGPGFKGNVRGCSFIHRETAVIVQLVSSDQ